MKKVFAVAAIFTCSYTLAQDSTHALEQVTVTASKYSTKTTETGKVVTIISREAIEHAGSRDLSQVLSELGGVFINGATGAPGKEKNVYLRGAKVDYTLITIDGVPVYDASGIGSNFDLRNIPIDNVERIQILKGSQSTLYGSDAIAGVINIITKKGGTKPVNINGVVSFGSYNSLRTHLNLSGSQKKVEYNAGVSHFTTDGFSQARQKETTEPPFEKDGYTETGVNASVGVAVTDAIKTNTFLRYNSFTGDVDVDAFTDDKDFTNGIQNLQAGIKNSITVGKAQLHLLYQYNHTIRDYLDDSGYVSSHAYFVYNREKYIANEHFAEAFMVHPFRPFKLTIGADARFSNTSFDGLDKNAYSPVVEHVAFSGDSVRQKQMSAYAALNFASGGWHIEGGGRYNHHSAYGSNFAFNLNPSYFIQEKIQLFVNASSGYKTPSLYQLFSLYGNRELQPENALNLEGGIKLLTENKKNYLRMLYFTREVKDVLAFVPIPAYPYSHYMNQDRQKDHGLEVEAAADIAGKVQLKAMYNYASGTITTKANGKDTSYFNLLRRPKSVFNFFAGSQLTKVLYVNLQLNAVGESKDLYFDPVTFSAEDITLPPYVLLNFYTEYSFLKKRLKVFADLRNITGSEYSDIYGYSTAGFNGAAGFRFQL